MTAALPEPSDAIDQLVTRVLDAAFEVHRTLGPGHLERTYEAAFLLELTSLGLAAARQARMPVRYKGQRLPGDLRIDLLVEGVLVVEVKAVENILPLHKVQVLAYVRAIGGELGLLINFNVPLLSRGVRRVINPYRLAMRGPGGQPRAADGT